MCWNVAELSIGLLAHLELCSRKFNSNCCIFGDSKVSDVHVVVGWIVSIGNIQSKDQALWSGGLCPVWICQSIIKTVCFQSRHEYANICRNVDYPSGEIVRCSVGGRVSVMCLSMFCKSVTGKTCGDSILEVVVSMYSIVCVETVWR